MSFARWLDTQPYRSSTVKRSLSDVRYAVEHHAETGKIPAAAAASVRRYMLYLQTEPPARPTPFDRALLGLSKASKPMAVRGRTVRKMAAVRVPEAEWRKLVDALSADTRRPEAIVLLLLARTGHRIGDILRLRRQELDAGRRSGVLQIAVKGGGVLEIPLAGAQDTWDRLSRTWRAGPDDTIALWVSAGTSDDPEAGAAAYKRCARYLKVLGKRLGLTGRVHLHRLRRTVAVKALSLTRDVHAVQQLLGHRSLQSTLRYVDELRRDEVEQLQRGLR